MTVKCARRFSPKRRLNSDPGRAVVKPIRELHNDTPIIILAGHTHTRNCSKR